MKLVALGEILNNRNNFRIKSAINFWVSNGLFLMKRRNTWRVQETEIKDESQNGTVSLMDQKEKTKLGSSEQTQYRPNTDSIVVKAQRLSDGVKSAKTEYGLD